MLTLCKTGNGEKHRAVAANSMPQGHHRKNQVFFNEKGYVMINSNCNRNNDIGQAVAPENNNDKVHNDKVQPVRMVPHQALHAEREKHKKTRMALMKLRQQNDEIQLAYFHLLTAAHQTSSNDHMQQAPDPEQNIVAYIRWLTAQMGNEAR